MRAFAEAIPRIRAEGIAILLAEQNASFAVLVADRVYVIENGRIQLEEQGEAVRAHPELLRRCLAVEGAARGAS